MARSSPKGLATAERLLGFVLLSAPENIEANALLGELSYKTGRTSQADPHLQRAASDHPELLFLLAKISNEQGRQTAHSRKPVAASSSQLPSEVPKEAPTGRSVIAQRSSGSRRAFLSYLLLKLR
jgi:hypothetical protein